MKRAYLLLYTCLVLQHLNNRHTGGLMSPFLSSECRRFTGKDRDTDGFTDDARDEKQPRRVKTSHPPIPPLPDKLTVPYDHYPPLPNSPPMPDAYSPLPDVSTLPDEEFSPLPRGRRVQSRGWRRRAADGRAIRRYLGRHAGVAMSAQLLRRILQREARRHSMWKGILQRLEKQQQQQLTPQPQDDDWSHDPKFGSWGLDSWSKPRETESKEEEEEEEEEEEGDVSAYSPSVKEQYLNMIRSKLLRQGTRKGKKAYSRRAPRPGRTKPEMDPESAEQGPPLDELYPFLDRKDAVSFFSSPATVSKRRRWLQKLIRMVKAHGSLDKKFDDDVSSDFEDYVYGEDTVDKDEQEDVFGDSDESKDDDEHSDEDSNEDMSDSQESSSDSDEVDDSSNERLADDVDDVSTESVDDREKGVLAFHGRGSPARRTSARRLPQTQRLINYRGKPRVGRRQQRLQHRRRQQAHRRRKVKPTRRIPLVKRLPSPRKLPAQRRLPNTRKLPGRRRFFPSRRRSTPATRKPSPARKLQPRGKPPTTRLHPFTRPPPPVRRPPARSPIWRWRQTGRRGNRRGRLHSRHRGAGARKQNRFGANVGPPRTRHTSATTRATTRTANDTDSTLMTTPPARLQWSSPADSDVRNSGPSTGGNRDQTGTSPDESTAFSETETKPSWTVSDEARPETGPSTDLTDGTAEEAELPAVLPDAEDGPDATPDLPGEVGDAGQMPDLEAVSTVYLGAVEGRRVKATRLDVLKEPLADHDTDRDDSDHHAAPVFLRVQYKPARHGGRGPAVGSLQRKRRNIDNDDVDATDNNDDSVDNRNTNNEDDNDGNDDDDDDDARRRNRRRRRWRTGGRNQRRRHDADNVSDGDEDDESDNNGDDEDAVRSVSQRRRQEWRRRRYRGNRRRQRVRIETDNDDDDRKDRNDGSLGFIQIGSSSNTQEREGRQSRRRDDSRRNHRRRNRNRKRRKNRRLQQQQRQHAAAGEAEGDDDVGDERPTRDDPPPYLPQIQTINNDNGNDNAGESEAYIRSPFINHRTAYDFLSTQARSRPQGHATSGRGSNEQRREQWQFGHTMSESMCEVFDKHFVPTSAGGRCE